MTNVETTAADLQEQARQTYRQSQAAEMPLTGKALGEMFDRSDRWGRDRIAEVRQPTADPLPFVGWGPATKPETLPEVERQPMETVTIAAAPIAAAEPVAEPGAAPVVAVETLSAAVQWTTRIAVAIVAAVAAAVSYAHMYQLAHHAGEGWRSWLLPLSVDGLIIAASMTLLVRKRQGLPGGKLAWFAMWLGVLASLAANVAAAAHTLEGRLVAAWPPVALLLAYELLMKQVKNARAAA